MRADARLAKRVSVAVYFALAFGFSISLLSTIFSPNGVVATRLHRVLDRVVVDPPRPSARALRRSVAACGAAGPHAGVLLRGRADGLPQSSPCGAGGAPVRLVGRPCGRARGVRRLDLGQRRVVAGARSPAAGDAGRDGRPRSMAGHVRTLRLLSGVPRAQRRADVDPARGRRAGAASGSGRGPADRWRCLVPGAHHQAAARAGGAGVSHCAPVLAVDRIRDGDAGDCCRTHGGRPGTRHLARVPHARSASWNTSSLKELSRIC